MKDARSSALPIYEVCQMMRGKVMIAGIRDALPAFAAPGADAVAAIDSGQFIAELRILNSALDEMAAGAIDRSLAYLSDLARNRDEKAAVKRLSKHVMRRGYLRL